MVIKMILSTFSFLSFLLTKTYLYVFRFEYLDTEFNRKKAYLHKKKKNSIHTFYARKSEFKNRHMP